MGNKINSFRNLEEKKFYDIKTDEEKIKFLLNYAILAPSTHNTQPWLFKIKKNSCEIYADEKLLLPYADPIKRDFYISIGCCIENLILISKYFNVFDKIEYKFKNNLICIVYFKDLQFQTKTNDEFYDFIKGIKLRFNARGLFENKNISNDILEKIKNLNNNFDLDIKFLTEKEKIDHMGKLIAKGLEVAYANKNFRYEMSNWINSNLSSRKEGIAGYALRMPFLISLMFPFMIKFLNLGKKLGYLNYLSIRSAPVSCLISSKNNNPLAWCQVGQLAERIMVYLASMGIKTSIFVSAIEMGFSEEVKKLFNINLIPQFHFCIGYIDYPYKYTLRHPVEEKLIT